MADLRVGKFTIGYSIRSFMAAAFTITTCVLTWKNLFPTEAFAGLAVLVIKAYFDDKGEANKEDNEP